MEDEQILKWNNHGSHLLQVFRVLRRSDQHADVSLFSGGKEFLAHKVVLSACSDYFATMLNLVRPEQAPIIFLDLDPQHMFSLLDYMYMGQVQIKASDVSGFLEAAQKLKIKGLWIDPNTVTATTQDEQFQKNVQLGIVHSNYLSAQFAPKPHQASANTFHKRTGDRVNSRSPPPKRKRMPFVGVSATAHLTASAEPVAKEVPTAVNQPSDAMRSSLPNGGAVAGQASDDNMDDQNTGYSASENNNDNVMNTSEVNPLPLVKIEMEENVNEEESLNGNSDTLNGQDQHGHEMKLENDGDALQDPLTVDGPDGSAANDTLACVDASTAASAWSCSAPGLLLGSAALLHPEVRMLGSPASPLPPRSADSATLVKGAPWPSHDTAALLGDLPCCASADPLPLDVKLIGSSDVAPEGGKERAGLGDTACVGSLRVGCEVAAKYHPTLTSSKTGGDSELSSPLAAPAASGGSTSAGLRLPVSVSPGLAAAIPALPVACLPSAFSSLATLGMGLCAATAATNGSISPSFGKISPTYGSGATGSRGGTPDIPQASSIGGGVTSGAAAPKLPLTPSNGTLLPKFVSTSTSLSPGSDVKIVTNGGSHANALSPASLSSVSNSSAPHAVPPPSNGSERQSYSCPLCGKQFGQPYNLRRHMSTHTGDRPFQCPHCEYAASQNVHLDKHIRRIHLNAITSGATTAGVNSTSSPCIVPKSNGINAGTKATSNGIIKVENCALSPKPIVNSHWKFESTAVTP